MKKVFDVAEVNSKGCVYGFRLPIFKSQEFLPKIIKHGYFFEIIY